MRLKWSRFCIPLVVTFFGVIIPGTLGYGSKFNRVPNTNDCKLTLNLPGNENRLDTERYSQKFQEGWGASASASASSSGYDYDRATPPPYRPPPPPPTTRRPPPPPPTTRRPPPPPPTTRRPPPPTTRRPPPPPPTTRRPPPPTTRRPPPPVFASAGAAASAGGSYQGGGFEESSYSQGSQGSQGSYDYNYEDDRRGGGAYASAAAAASAQGSGYDKDVEAPQYNEQGYDRGQESEGSYAESTQDAEDYSSYNSVESSADYYPGRDREPERVSGGSYEVEEYESSQKYDHTRYNEYDSERRRPGGSGGQGQFGGTDREQSGSGGRGQSGSAGRGQSGSASRGQSGSAGRGQGGGRRPGSGSAEASASASASAGAGRGSGSGSGSGSRDGGNDSKDSAGSKFSSSANIFFDTDGDGDVDISYSRAHNLTETDDSTELDDGSKVAKDRRFALEVLAAHNNYRHLHGVPPLALDEKMSEIAQKTADGFAAGLPFKHSDASALDAKYGENIAYRTGRSSGNAVVEDWYSEIKNYDFDDPEVSIHPPHEASAHFTAIVWKSTKTLGIAKARGKDGKLFIVATYYPPGNFPSKLRDNVLPPTNKE